MSDEIKPPSAVAELLDSANLVPHVPLGSVQDLDAWLDGNADSFSDEQTAALLLVHLVRAFVTDKARIAELEIVERDYLPFEQARANTAQRLLHAAEDELARLRTFAAGLDCQKPVTCCKSGFCIAPHPGTPQSYSYCPARGIPRSDWCLPCQCRTPEGT